MKLKNINTIFLTTIFAIMTLPISVNALMLPTRQTETAPIDSLEMAPDPTSLTATVIYKNGCYTPWIELVGVEGNQIYLAHMIEVEDGLCVYGLEVNEVSFSLDTVDEGHYTVRDAHNGLVLGSITKSDGEVTLIN